jgi:hypothetical protein
MRLHAALVEVAFLAEIRNPENNTARRCIRATKVEPLAFPSGVRIAFHVKLVL